MKFLNKRLCLGNKIDPILDSYIRYIPTTERVAYIAPLLVQEVIAKDQLVSSQPGKVDSGSGSDSEDDYKLGKEIRTVRDHIEAMFTTNEALDALKLISLAATHNIYFPDFEIKLMDTINNENIDLIMRVETAMAYIALRTHSLHHKVDQDLFKFNEKEETEFLSYIAMNTDFEMLPDESHLEAIKRFGIMRKNKIENDFATEQKYESNYRRQRGNTSKIEETKAEVDESSKICKTLLIKKIIQMTDCSEELQIQKLKQNINKLESSNDLGDYLALRDATLDALVQ